MADNCIGGWTIETLRYHINSMMEERRRQADERFRQIELTTKHADELLAQYKIAANEYRATFLSREEYLAEHRGLITKIDAVKMSLDQRLAYMDKERNIIKDDVTVIKSRSGYISWALIVSVSSGMAAILFNVISHILWTAK